MSEFAEPIIIEGPEQSLLDPALADLGLPPAVGVQSFCVFRASKAAAEITDQKGYTYHHHVDMACWRGRLYVGWNSCQRDEDVWPSRELYSTSSDGVTWSDPQEMFPQGVSTPLRMYFFCASNGRMLMIAGLRADQDETDEDKKGALVVREIRPDHALGEIFTLQHPLAHSPVLFVECADPGFVAACRELLADNVFLEQQDRGRLLGARRMKWHEPSAWGGKVPGDSDKWVAGKAYSFFTRIDGAIVGVSKMGWVTTSSDGGQTWTRPAVPPTLVTGKAKVWAQRTRDGRYALVYNPSARNRFPLVVVTGEDGITFRDMRIVQAELPRQRYPGLHRSIGPQYVRGLSRWSDDGSRAGEMVMWVTYSMNKEDIWVSRVPLPVRPDESRRQISGVDDLNLYVPKWAGATLAADQLCLENSDPFDAVCATRVMPESAVLRATFEMCGIAASRPLQISVAGKFGATRAMQISIPPQPERQQVELIVDAVRQEFEMTVQGKSEKRSFTERVPRLHRFSFRVGEPAMSHAGHVAEELDKPQPPVTIRISNLRTSSS
jgi:hypothetical protein